MRKFFTTISVPFLVLVFALSSWAGESVLFGPESFTVNKGKPLSIKRSFAAPSQKATLKLTNGNPQGDLRVSSGSITLNGMEIFTPSAFNQQVASIEHEILLKDDNVLEVSFGGAPGSVVTMSIIGEEAAPPPPAPTATLTADPPSITAGESANLSWMTLNAERAWVEPGVGEIPLAGEVKISPTQTTLYRLFAEGPGGQAQAEATVTVSAPPPSLGITFDPYKGAPLDGATVGARELTIGGSVLVENPAEVGVRVNDVVAMVQDGRFIANNILLDEGLNTLTVTATDADGQTWSATAEVLCLPDPESVNLKADATIGLAPLTATFSITDNLTEDIADFSLECSGPVEHTPIADADNTFQGIFDVPGLYTCKLNIRDILGMNYEDTIGINVYAREELDVQLQAKWNALTQALWYGDVNTARTFFSTRTAEAYGQLMDSRVSILDQMVADMQGIELVRLEGEKAIYDLRIVNDGTPYSFQLEFILDEDGLWRIRAF